MTVLVIGSGIIGAAIAEALAAAGARVTILEMRSPGAGASQASAGILAPYVEADATSPLLPLAVRSLALYDEFVARLRGRTDTPFEYRRDGTLQVALDDHAAAHLSSSAAALDADGVETQWLDAAGLAAFEPQVSPRARGGLFIAAHGHVDARALVRALIQSARFAGATIESPVEASRVSARTDHVDVLAGDRRYTADRVVIAAGSWGKRVRVEHLAAMPLRPVRGQLLHLTWSAAAAAPPPSRVVWGPRCYVVPRTDRSVLVGATVEEVGFDERVTVAGVRHLTDAVSELLPAAASATLDDVWVGLRPAMPDDLPVIGPFEAAPNVVMAGGHYRNGVLLAPLTAAIVADYVLHGRGDPAFGLTTPDRFLRSA